MGDRAWLDAHGVDSPTALAGRLDATGYLADAGLATAAFLALRMGRPLFCEGEAGVGKTSLAQALATLLDVPLIRLQCYEGIDAAQALYDWDFPRQLLHLRAAESAGVHGVMRDGVHDTERLETELYDRRFLVARPLLRAVETGPAVLLIDEVDRADDEFEAYLFELLAESAVTIPELGTRRAAVPPVAVLTSNRTRDLHDALKRRCLYHWIGYPDVERVAAIIRRRVPAAGGWLAEQVAGAVARLRGLDLAKPPGVAEAINWATALHVLGAPDLDASAAERTLGAVLKYAEDGEVVHAAGLARVVGGG